MTTNVRNAQPGQMLYIDRISATGASGNPIVLATDIGVSGRIGADGQGNIDVFVAQTSVLAEPQPQDFHSSLVTLTGAGVVRTQTPLSSSISAETMGVARSGRVNFAWAALLGKHWVIQATHATPPTTGGRVTVTN